MGCACQNNASQMLLYACSGAANTGELADRVCRTLARENQGSMTCLAGLGAEISGFTISAQSTPKNIVVDGCKVSCGKKIFDRLGLDYEHFLMTDFGVEKNKTPITPELVTQVAHAVAERITT